jgi:hypothetical protein
MHRILVAVSVFAMLAWGQQAGRREISLSDLRDKIEGGWAGKMIGVSFGAPTEFRAQGKIMEGPLPKWTPDRVSNSLGQDDLYVNMTFAQVLDNKGLEASTADFGDMFRQARYGLWHANLAGRRALKRGVAAGASGTPKYNAHANDIDFQIESDFIGLMTPGMPQSANRIAERAGRVMNYGDGIYGGMFVAGMYSAAYFEDDPRKVVEAGLRGIPAKSPYGLLIADVLMWSRLYPNDWKRVWRLIEDKWDRCEPCPEGALKPFNIDAKLNGGYIALGLLYGGKDFGRTIEIATRAGQDSDCNPSTAGGVLGVMLGYRGIPEAWKSGISEIASKQFQYTEFTFRTIVSSTEKRAIMLAEQNGGRLEDGKLTIKAETPKAPKLEVWNDYGCPAERVGLTDARWQFAGDWRAGKNVRIASAKGAQATIRFRGTGAIVTGPYLPAGGKADVYLDGKLDRTVDVYPDEDSVKNGEAVWHAFRLKDAEHTVRVVVRGEPYPGSKGSEVGIEGLVVFR